MKAESDLYLPIKVLLEAQGYAVKGEVGAVDIVAVRGDEPPVIVELKRQFSLSLFHQAVNRLALTDFVYIAVPRPTGRNARRMLKDNTALCRRLGLGLITVREGNETDILCDPKPYTSRKSKKRVNRLLKEFHERHGDPNLGGATRRGIMTTYRQRAIRVAEYLAENGPTKGAVVGKAVIVPNATRIMADNHYGWFERKSIGVYQITETGQKGLLDWTKAEEGVEKNYSAASLSAIE